LPLGRKKAKKVTFGTAAYWFRLIIAEEHFSSA
jgi:hypothetical protein